MGSARTLAEAFDAAKARTAIPAGTAMAETACGGTTSVPGEGGPVFLEVELHAKGPQPSQVSLEEGQTGECLQSFLP